MTQYIYPVNNHISNLEEVLLPTKTYKVIDGRIRGYTDGHDAMIQAIDKALRTKRMVNLIYSWQYGHDLEDLIGKEEPYARKDLGRMIEECLKADERVLQVRIGDISKIGNDSLSVSVQVETIYGSVLTGMEVTI